MLWDLRNPWRSAGAGDCQRAELEKGQVQAVWALLARVKCRWAPSGQISNYLGGDNWANQNKQTTPFSSYLNLAPALR